MDRPPGVPGLFISFEGNEGCGKSTQVGLVCEALTRMGHQVRAVREPGSTAIGENIRTLFKNPPQNCSLSAWTEVFMLSAARHQLVTEVILPALRNGEIVISDRFVDSTLAYQGIIKSLPRDALQYVCNIATQTLEPARTYLFKAPVKLLMERVMARGQTQDQGTDRFDQAGIQEMENLEAAFDQIASENPVRIRVMDATQSKEELCQFLTEDILRCLKKS